MGKKIDISTGRYWDKAWSLVEGCTPVSLACNHCWLATMEHRYGARKIASYCQDCPLYPLRQGLCDTDVEGSIVDGTATGYTKHVPSPFTDSSGRFNGTVRIREDRLDLPLETRKPTVFAIWSDLFHEKVPDAFIEKALNAVYEAKQHTFLILTKRPERLASFMLPKGEGCGFEFENVYWGTTVENQEQKRKKVAISSCGARQTISEY